MDEAELMNVVFNMKSLRDRFMAATEEMEALQEQYFDDMTQCIEALCEVLSSADAPTTLAGMKPVGRPN